MASLSDDLGNSKKILEEINKSSVDFQSTLNAIQQALKGVAKEEKDIADLVEVAESNAKKLNRSAEYLANIKSKDLKNDKKAQSAKLRFEGLLAKNKAIQATLNDRIANASKSEATAIARVNSLMSEVEESSKEVSDNFNEVAKSTDKINKRGKGFENIATALNTIPGIGPVVGKAFNNAAAAARKSAESGDSFAMSMAKGATELVTLKGIFTLLTASLFAADKRTTELAKSLQISKDEAREINKEFIEISMNSGKAYLNQKSLIEATIELSNHLGVANKLNSDITKTQTFLTKQMGLSASEAGKLAENQIFTGKSAKKAKEEIAKQAAQLQKETGIAVNLNEVFAEVAKANAGLQAAYGFNNKLIAKQVVNMKELGLTLDQAGKMASQLLDFESSISKELEAELLTGKDLNLEKARLLALQGKNTEAAAELAKQVGGTAELSRMNVIQQEALASAMGMERNELIQSVQKREILARLGATSIEQLKERGELDKLNSSELGKQLLAQYEQESAAAKFESAVIKIQEAIGSMMEGPFGTFIDGLANAVSSAGTMKTIMYSLGAMSLGRMIAQLGTMVALNSASAAAAMTTAGALTLGIGLIAIVAAVGSAMSSMESQAQSSAMNMRNVNDGMIGPGGNSVLSTSKGSFQFAAEDTIIATSNKPGNNSSKTEEKFDKLIALFEKGNKNTEAIAKKDTNLTVNAIPGVAYEQQQLNNQQVFNTSVS
jgi:hypothetical protein